MRRFLTAVLLSALLLTLHGTPINNSQAKVAVAKPARQVHQKVTAPAQVARQVETSVPQVPAPQTVTGCEAYRNMLAQYSWNVEVALQVMEAESTYKGIPCNPAADNADDYHPTCLGSRGLFQIGCDSTDNYAGMFDPATNIAQAYRLYASRGWQPWSSTTCAVKVRCY